MKLLLWSVLLGVLPDALGVALMETVCFRAKKAECIAECPGFAWCEMCDACLYEEHAVKDEL